MSEIEDLLRSISPNTSIKNGYDYVLITCPFHGGGMERTPSCSVSKTKPVFFCHGCHESGHLSRLLKHLGMSGDAANVVIKSLGLNSPRQKAADKAAQRYRGANPFRGEYKLPEEILDDWRLAPKSLLDVGFAKETLRHFEVGFDSKNLRITYPLRNIYGELVGVSGRAAVAGIEPRYKIYRDELISEEEYNIPESYSMDSVKSALLWHGHVVQPYLYNHDDEVLIITEGFKACMWTWQAGYQNTVALVGSYLSDLQAELICTAVQHVCLFLDNNEAGIKGTMRAAHLLSSMGVRVVIARYPDDREQPDELTTDEITEAFRNHLTFSEWKAEDGKEAVRRTAWRRFLRNAVS
jgi:DNA primase